MRSEVEKLYELAGVETNKYKLCCTGCEHIAKLEVINGYPSKWICDKYDEVADCDKAEPDYPPFTAEKQINLITYLIKNGRLCIRKADNSDAFYMDTSNTRGDGVDNYNFSECLASIVYLYLKQYDTPKFKQEEIRKILKG